jgi:hypothetical protein
MSSVVSPDEVEAVVLGGGFFSRAQIAEELGREKTTHVVAQIEQAWAEGRIEKVWGEIGKQWGWLYFDPYATDYHMTAPEDVNPREGIGEAYEDLPF